MFSPVDGSNGWLLWSKYDVRKFIIEYDGLIQIFRRQRFQAMLNTKPRCTLVIGHVIDKIFNQCTRQHCTTEGTTNLTERTRIRKATRIGWAVYVLRGGIHKWHKSEPVTDRLIWWEGCDIDLQWTQCFTGPYCVNQSLSHTYTYEETSLSLV